MYHFITLFAVLFASIAQCIPVDPPLITPAPVPEDLAVEILRRQGIPIDPVSLANVLLTAFPQSLREIAATNVDQVSRILWSEFLDGQTPSWFQALPSDIQGYLSYQYGPSSLRAQTTTDDSDSSSTNPSTSMTTTLPSQTSTATSQSDSASISVSSTIANSEGESSVPAPPASEDDSEGGLTLAQKLGVGLGVPLGVLVIALAILACCFLARRRSRRGRSKETEERAPTPAFIASSHRAPSMEQKWAPLPVPQNLSNRGRDSGFDNDFHNGGFRNGDLSSPNGYQPRRSIGQDGFATAPVAAMGAIPAARRSRNNSASRSQTSLQSVRESPMEFTHTNTATAVPAPPARRSRTSLNGTNGFHDQYNGAVSRRSVDANAANSTLPLSPLNPSYDSGALDGHSTHPALRGAQDTSPMLNQPPYAQNQHSNFLSGGFGGSQRTKGYTNIPAPEESHRNAIADSPTYDFLHNTGDSHPYGAEWDNTYRSSRKQDPSAYQTADWPLRNGKSLKGSRWSAGSASETRPLWNGNMYEGT